jgi:endonuclease/exonuclease/phosphatase family metal-dependent hydrolase
MFRRILLLAGLAACLASAADLLRVLTYNVRYPSKDDGPDLWEKRKDLFVASVRAVDADLIGTQELFYIQGEYLVAQAPEYKWFGISRRGNKEDEHMGVFYKPAKLRLLNSGKFWLSETPDVPGSISWNMSLPRMVTWGLFEKRDGSKQRFYFFNTHFAHRREDDPARLKSAELIAAKITEMTGKQPYPVILTGDFNSPGGSAVHAKVESTGLADAWTKAPFRFGPENTFHGFRGTPDGRRIDWIFSKGDGIQPVLAETITVNHGGRYPSDHFPVLAVFALR